MALDANIVGNNLDGGSNIKVALSNTPAYIGGIRNFSENDTGAITGTPYLLSPETSSDYRLRVGIDTVLFTDTFNSTIQNTNLWSYTFATMTMTLPGTGYLNVGTVQGTASGHGAFLKSYQHFPVIGTAPLSAEFTLGQFTNTISATEAFYFGLGIPSAAATIPTDGVWFKITSSGLYGEFIYNGGTPTTTGLLISLANLTLNSTDKYAIVIGETEIEFWKDDVLLTHATIPLTNGQPFQAGSLPCFIQKVYTGVTSNLNVFRVTDITISLMDLATNKPWAHQAAVMGQSCNIFQNGSNPSAIAPYTQAIGTVTTGSSPLLIAGTAGSNSAANATGLGGYGTVTASVAAATDIIACSFQNPVPSVTITGRNLIITGVSISAINLGAAVATTATTLLWSIGYGHTAVSMATLETASFVTATTHAPRRMQLGFMSAAIGAAIGATYDKEIIRKFDAPIVVRPGEFINTFYKVIVGTATASQVIGYNVLFDGYWE